MAAWAALAPTTNVLVTDGERLGACDIDRSGMDHRRVQAVERAALQHDDLAAAALLGRGAEHRDGQAEVVSARREGAGGADRGRGDDVVLAGVSESGQRVVLGADPDVQRPGADGRGERGRQPLTARVTS